MANTLKIVYVADNSYDCNCKLQNHFKDHSKFHILALLQFAGMIIIKQIFHFILSSNLVTKKKVF